MEPFFLDRSSQFRALAEAVVENTQLQGVPIVVASFNQKEQIAGRQSPHVLFRGTHDTGRVHSAIAALDLPRRPDRRYADTDFQGALQSAMGDLLGGGEGVIWMFTNNKNSPNNSQDVANNTRKFYEIIRSSPYITTIMAFPIRMAVSGPNYSERGFMIYAFAYGEMASRALKAIVADGGPIRSVFTSPPATLKPIGEQAISLALQRQERDGVTASYSNGVLALDGVPGGEETTFSFSGRLKNEMYPHKIASASVALGWVAYSGGATPAVSVTPDRIVNLASKAESEPMTISVTAPAIPRPAGLMGLFEDSATIDGVMKIALNDVRLELDDDFTSKLKDVFGAEVLSAEQSRVVEEKIPDVFFDFRQVSGTTTQVPIRFVVRYSMLPLYLIGAGGAALIILGVGAAVLLTRARMVTVNLAGMSRQLLLKPGKRAVAIGGDGLNYAITGRAFGAPKVEQI